MNINSIIEELKAERDCIEHAIAAIEGLNSTGHTSTTHTPRTAVRSRRSRMSAAARRKLSQLMKQRWAQGKMKPKQATASKSARSMSAAGRKRISQAAKRRWAEWRRMQKKPVAKAA